MEDISKHMLFLNRIPSLRYTNLCVKLFNLRLMLNPISRHISKPLPPPLNMFLESLISLFKLAQICF